MWKSLIKNINDILFPSFCLGCGKEGSYLCLDCQAIIEISEYNYCLCGNKPIRLPVGDKKGKCYRCQDKKLSGLYSALAYKEKALTRTLIQSFKYSPYIRDLKKVLAGIIIEHLILAKNNKEEIWENGILVPVPLEKNKLKTRGYNQAKELAQELSKIIKTPVVADALLKTKSTPDQIKLSKEEREKNLADAFSLKNADSIKGKKIFLIDDVYTTGSTMEECARTLKQSGARQVWGIVAAREG